MSFDNTNRGALFKNDRKEWNSQPDYRGNLDIDGIEYRINAWFNTSRAGGQYLSLTINQKEERRDRGREARRDIRGFGRDEHK